MVGVFHARSILAVNPLVGGDIYSFQNLMGVAFLGIWLIFSTIAAPVIIQKAVATGSLAASHLLSGAFAAGKTGGPTDASRLAKGRKERSGGGWASSAGVYE